MVPGSVRLPFHLSSFTEDTKLVFKVIMVQRGSLQASRELCGKHNCTESEMKLPEQKRENQKYKQEQSIRMCLCSSL